MARRFVVADLHEGVVSLDERQAGHLRDVLRLLPGAWVELMDAAGRTARAKVLRTAPAVELEVEAVNPPGEIQTRLVIAAAAPKGTRADWMVEKLSELGVDTYIPLESQRSVVHPEAGKRQRWGRIAQESAKQCKRQGIMRIAEPASLEEVGQLEVSRRLCLSTEPAATPVMDLTSMPGTVLAAIGPEGGWTPREIEQLSSGGFEMVALTGTILRIETAAIALASIMMCKVKQKESQ